jgi:hypothetical protein
MPKREMMPYRVVRLLAFGISVKLVAADFTGITDS